jgi:hypothetical protein
MERNENEIIHCGWLEKKGRVMKNWKRRWFTLRLQLLEYFDAQNGNKKGDIEISSETIVLLRDGSTHLFKFGIQTGNRILELSTNSDQDRIQWMDAIHNTVKLIQNRNTKASHNDGRIKDRVSNLLSKKTNMDEDTPMNRALRGHATAANDSTTTSKPPPRRANRRPRNKKTVQMSSHDRGNDCSSEESDQEQETVSRAGSEAVAVDETPVADLPSPPPQPLPEGWAQVMTEDGRIYYYHKVTRVSRSIHLPFLSSDCDRWDFPTDEQPQQTQSQESNTDPPVVSILSLLFSTSCRFRLKMWNQLQRLSMKSRPRLFFTSASSLPRLAMTSCRLSSPYLSVDGSSQRT